MNRYTMGRRAALAVLMTVTAGLGSQAVGQNETPNLPARDHNSARSSPPDTTPYVRPLIPQDRDHNSARSSPPDTTPYVRPLIPQDRDHNSARSSPPDTTPYVRPLIPQDLVQTPFLKRRATGPRVYDQDGG
jgi:hypothetical protein